MVVPFAKFTTKKWVVLANKIDQLFIGVGISKYTIGFANVDGCEEPLTLAQVYKETSGFCSDLNKDSHFKDERFDVIIERYIKYKDPTDENKYQLLKDFESYNQCINVAAKIEHIK